MLVQVEKTGLPMPCPPCFEQESLYESQAVKEVSSGIKVVKLL